MNQKLFDDSNTLDKSKLTSKDIMSMQKENNYNIIVALRRKLENNKAVFFRGNTPSLKNNKQIIHLNTKMCVCHKDINKPMYKDHDGLWKCAVTGKPTQRYVRASLASSKQVQEYEEDMKPFFLQKKIIWDKFKPDYYPINLGLYFVRNSNRTFDYINAAQIIMDQMQKYNYIKEDNIIYVKPFFLGYHVDPKNPCCIMTEMDDELFKLIKK